MPKRAMNGNKMICLDAEMDITDNVRAETISRHCKKENSVLGNDTKTCDTLVKAFKLAGFQVDSTADFSVKGQLNNIILVAEILFQQREALERK